MKGFMQWAECEKSFIRKVTPDEEKALALVEASKRRMGFLGKINAEGDEVSFLVEGHYEAVKELLTALLLLKGMKSSNHQCLISYFYLNYPKHEDLANLLLQLNHARNRLNYYGELVDPSFYQKNKEEMERLVAVLRGIVGDALKADNAAEDNGKEDSDE